MSEAEFQERVVGLAQGNGWQVLWVRPVRVQRRDGSVYFETPFAADGTGWPDLLCCRPPRLVALELKAKKNRPTVEQRRWLELLRACGVHAEVYWPRDWGEIEGVLR